jgi:DNA polymerase/3'-5' exonuclease PolX
MPDVQRGREGDSMIHDEALSIAELLVDLFAPACKRIEVAGSVRRMKPEVGDIEIVAVPDLRPPRPAFGQRPYATLLEAIIAGSEMEDDNPLRLHSVLGGNKYKKFWVSIDHGQTWNIKLDLFLVTPPSEWGVEYLIRTGPREFSQWMVTEQYRNGALPNGCRCEGNAIRNKDGAIVPMPEEIDYLNFCGLSWIKPSKRVPVWKRTGAKSQVRQLIQDARHNL